MRGERMDQFVQNQLTLIGCEDLIPLFRDKGYNEVAYKKLTLRKLMQLLPEDDGGELAFKIMCNIQRVNNPDSTSGSGLFPPPNVIVKTDPSLETEQQQHSHSLQDDDDEVQVLDITIRAPSAFTRMEIKEEIHEEWIENAHAHQPIHGANHDEQEPANTGGTTADRTNIVKTESDRIPQSRKRGRDTVTAEPPPKADRSMEAEWSWWKFIEFTFGRQTSSRLTKAQLKERFGDKLKFKLSTTTKLDDALRLMETYNGRLRYFVKKLELTVPPSPPPCEDAISNVHLHRLANLPEFLNRLTKLTFNVQFPETTNFFRITTLLSKCSSLTHLKVQRGVVLTGDESVSLHIPKMDKLVSFSYAATTYLAGPEYTQPPTPVDVETDTPTRASKQSFFQVLFSNFTFPALEVICLGPFIELEFENLAQFPKMKTLDAGRVSSIKPLSWFSTDSTCSSVTSTRLLGVAQIELIHLIPRAFPNITKLSLTFPAINTLRSVITKMGDMQIQHLSLTVNFEFESAFLTAFCGHRFKLVTKQDKRKFDKLEKYKHWKGFMKHLGIVPEHESSNEESNPDESTSEATLSSFRFLQTFKLRHIKARIYLPVNHLHWNNPDVQLSSSRWSSIKQRLPNTILLEELGKLKGQLQKVNVPGFEVEQRTIAKFEEIMGFKLSFDTGNSKKGRDLDTFARTDSIEGCSRQGIKQEK